MSTYPTTIEEKLLRQLVIYHYLTPEQFFIAASQQSIHNTRARLKRLVDLGYLIIIHRRTTEQNLPLARAYRLTGKAITYLEESGVTLYPREPAPNFLDHTLEVNNLLISLAVLIRNDPDSYRIDALEHERELRLRKPPLLAVPDAYVDVVLTKSKQSFPMFFELDRNEEKESQWFDKIERYTKFFPSQMRQSFETEAITVVTFAPTKKRVIQLQEWTEDALKRLRQRDLGELFYFGVSTREMLPTELFITQRFAAAFQREAVALFDV